MKLFQSSCWVFSGLILAASAVYAQDAVSQNTSSEAKSPVKKSPVKKPKSAVKRSLKPDVRPVQVKHEPDRGTKSKQETFQRAEAEARKQAEIEARAIAEQEARQRIAEAQEASQRAAEKSKKQAEIEALQKPLREADGLIKNGKPADAYTLLEPFEFERSGEVRFDYLLGIAALDSGKPDKATLAFERVMAVDPNFAGARLDMARAYYQLGDLPRAKTEFTEVMKLNPPEAARITIQKYLDAIAAYTQAKQTRVTGYVEGAVGYDSNIANSSTQTFFFAPTSPYVFLGFTQLPPAAKLQGIYGGGNAGGEISHSLNANWSVNAGGDLRVHSNMTQRLYDTTSTAVRVGMMYANEKNAYKLTLTNGEQYSASTMRLDSLGISAELQHAFSPSNQMSAFAQYGQNRAFGVQPTSPATDVRIEGNTDQVVAGAGWVHILADGKQAVFGSVYSGNEFDVAPVISAGLPNGGRADGKKRFRGWRAGLQVTISEQMDLIESFGWQHSTYSNTNILIMDKRNESLYDISIGANWRLNKLWTVKPQFAISRKISNLALYSFGRTDISLTIRRDFK